jgi:cell division septal protein FtsQ
LVKKKKNKSIVSLLNYPKTKKKSEPFAFRKYFVGFLVVSLCAIASFFIFQYSSAKGDGNALTIHITGSGVEQLSPKSRSKVESIIRSKVLDPANRKEDIASQIQSLTNSGLVSILRSGFQTFVINIEARHALFYIQADKPRFLSSQGQIYGIVPASQKDLMIEVSGIFEPSRKDFEFSQDHTLTLTPAETKRISNLLELNKYVVDNDLAVTAYRFINYRGFEITLKDHSTKVLLGKSSFSEKLERLKNILNDLNQKGKQAQIIELDYKGKAFIKEAEL